MKTFFALILTALMAIMPAMGATTVEESVLDILNIEGTVVEITEEGILISTDSMPAVLVKVSDETVWDGNETLVTGDYIYVDYDGIMTRSIPPQITAMRICCRRLDGVVTEVYAEENAMLITTETNGEVYVHLPRADAETASTSEGATAETDVILPAMGDQVAVYFNGVMTMSLPGQINAGLIVILPVEAA